MPSPVNFQFVRAECIAAVVNAFSPSFRCWRGRRLCGNSHSTVLQYNHSRLLPTGEWPLLSYRITPEDSRAARASAHAKVTKWKSLHDPAHSDSFQVSA